MINKRFRLRNIVVIAAIFLAASCNKTEENSLDYEGSPNSVTFSIDIPTEYQVSRSSFPVIPTDHQLRCIIEVWDSSLSSCIAREEILASSESDAKVSIELEDATYNYVVWSDYISSSATKTDGHYTDLYYTTNDETEGLKGISITSQRGSDPANREAFYQATTEFTMASKSLSLSASLTRAISMLTIAESNIDNLAACSAVTITYDTPSLFDAASGSTSSTANVTYQGTIGDEISVDGTVCKALFVDYILADVSGNSTLGEVSMSLTSSSNSVSFPNITIPAGIPIKQNYQTYAVGEIVNVVSVDTDSSQEPDGDTTVDDGNNDSTSSSNNLNLTLSFLCDWSATITHTIVNLENAIEISTIEELVALATEVNNADSKLGVYYKLTQDIDFTGTSFTSIGTSSSKSFRGNFDGDGHKITGIALSSSSQYCGVFGYISDGAVISNLTIEGTITNSRTSGTYAGGLTGRSNTGSKITNCHSEMNITIGSSGNVGGISGYNDGGTIIGSSFSGTINSSISNSSAIYCGGIVGTNYNSVINCYCTGVVSMTLNDTETASDSAFIGGLIGYNNGECVNSYNSAEVKADGVVDRKTYIGGVAGSTSTGSSTANCYNIGTTSSTSANSTIYIGSVVGYNDTSLSTISNVYSIGGTDSDGESDYSLKYSIGGGAAAATAEFATKLNATAQSYNNSSPANEAYGWNQSESVNGGYPTLTTTSAGVNK
ncbi:MAG: DUF6562 domain-containing protein [Rikenellaceae bacterium]